MSLGNYLDRAGESGQEIRWDFSQEEIQKLYKLLKELGYVEYRHFVQESRELIVKYLSLSPSQRQQKKWINHPHSLGIRFAALQLSRLTAAFQSDVYDLRNLVDGGSYRAFHSVLAAGLMNQHTDQPFLEFPFEGFDNPFYTDKE